MVMITNDHLDDKWTGAYWHQVFRNGLQFNWRRWFCQPSCAGRTHGRTRQGCARCSWKCPRTRYPQGSKLHRFGTPGGHQNHPKKHKEKWMLDFFVQSDFSLAHLFKSVKPGNRFVTFVVFIVSIIVYWVMHSEQSLSSHVGNLYSAECRPSCRLTCVSTRSERM